jgi:hypothetical protein
MEGVTCHEGKGTDLGPLNSAQWQLDSSAYLLSTTCPRSIGCGIIPDKRLFKNNILIIEYLYFPRLAKA